MNTKLRGFSIVELLIAMTLGLVLSAGIIQVFLANRQAQRIEQSVARLQENGRIALDLITQDLRMAGFIGCGAVPNPTSNEARKFTNHVAALNGGNSLFDGVSNPWGFASRSVRGFRFANNNWTPALPAQGITVAAVNGARGDSDVLAVYGAEQVDAVLNGAVKDAENIVVDRLSLGRSCFSQNQRVMISDCDSAELITITNQPDCGNAQLVLEHADNLSKEFSGVGIPATSVSRPRILSFYSHAYFVAPSGRIRSDNSQVMSLFRWDGARATELVEGIEFLRVEFGQKVPDTTSIRYVDAATVGADWSGITSVRIGVLAQSFELVRDTNDTGNYTVAGQPINAVAAAGEVAHGGGRTLRQAYTTTVELRNSH